MQVGHYKKLAAGYQWQGIGEWTDCQMVSVVHILWIDILLVESTIQGYMWSEKIYKQCSTNALRINRATTWNIVKQEYQGQEMPTCQSESTDRWHSSYISLQGMEGIY